VEAADIEAAVAKLVELFQKSVREIVVVRKELEDGEQVRG
jgi:hypothetical protein